MEASRTKCGFSDEFEFKRNIQYQPLPQIIKATASKANNLITNNINAIQCNKSTLFKVLPILEWISCYNLSWFKKDLIAGITVSIISVPQSLAYAVLAGLPPVWGLYASIMPVMAYMIFGTSTQMAVGPVATTSIMFASVVEKIASGGNELEYEQIAIALSFVTGIMLILFGLLRAGFITLFLSTPVMVGFITSAACIVLTEQFRSLLGLDIPRSPVLYETVMNIFNSIHTLHTKTTLVAVISLFLLCAPKWFPDKIPKWVPMPLFVLIIMVIASWLLDLQSLGVSVVGNEVETGFLVPSVPEMKYFFELVPGAVVLAIVSYMGSIALAKGLDQKTKEDYANRLELYECFNDTEPLENKFTPRTPLLSMSVESAASLVSEVSSTAPILLEKPTVLPSVELNANAEFIAFGIANVVGSFFGAQVISGSFSRSALNNEMRGQTQMSSFVQATICLLCLLFLMPLLAPLPNAVLAAVVTVCVHRLIKNGIAQFIFLYNVSRIELIEFITSVIAPLIVGLEIGIFVAIACSFVVSLIRHIFVDVIQLGTLKTISNDNEYVDVEMFQQANFVENITILELKSELSFANSRKLIDKIRELLDYEEKYIIISLAATQIIDTTSIGQIVTLFGNARKAHIAFTCCRPDIINVFERFQLKKKEFPININVFISTHDAVTYFNNLMESV